jgi:hypothetical protein
MTSGAFSAKLSLQCRLEMLTDDFTRAVHDLRRTSDVTLEFGVQTIHRAEERAINRPNNRRKLERWLQRLNEEGVPYELTLIYGLPEQTLDSFAKTVDWALETCSRHAMGRAEAKFWPLMHARPTLSGLCAATRRMCRCAIGWAAESPMS